ncbi:Cell division control protein 1 [Spathaspora sp. JA1]|nr:Cell division control protein 1 [Spathaspora sp. JA1]
MEQPNTKGTAKVRDKKNTRVKWQAIVLFTVIWTLSIHYFERIVPYNTLGQCTWDKWEHWPEDRLPHRIALIADPQIIDDYSYPKQFKFFNFIVKQISDNYLHRNFQIMQRVLDPNSTIFLGDLFDGGRYWNDTKWMEEFHRFNRVFPKRTDRVDIRSIPGNHDIGFQTIKRDVVDRFAKYHGKSNDIVTLGNHTIIMFDSISYSHPDPEISKEAKQFISKEIPGVFPRILLTHVPLYRFKETQLCGPLRESKKLFPIMRGVEYQTVIEWEFSQNMLKTFQPEIIFAGDDHDYCDIFQEYELPQGGLKKTREIAVKSAAMTSGIKRPAIQLLSLSNPGKSEVFLLQGVERLSSTH